MVIPVGPSSGRAAVGSLIPRAFKTATLLMVGSDVDKATGLRGIRHVNDCIT